MESLSVREHLVLFLVAKQTGRLPNGEPFLVEKQKQTRPVAVWKGGDLRKKFRPYTHPPNMALHKDIPEFWRLMKREIIHATAPSDDVCAACYRENHTEDKCPYLEEIKPDDFLAPEYDRVCHGCGRIGLTCCSVGSFAVSKWCLLCGMKGHWLWEEKCPNYACVNLRTQSSWRMIKNGTPFLQRPIIIPDFRKKEDEDELRRLMGREIPADVDDKDCCGVCHSKDHPYFKCTFLDFIPDSKCVGPKYDEVCLGCGKIGKRCCSKGAYAVQRECQFCDDYGHWYWEDKCNKDRLITRVSELYEAFKIWIRNNISSTGKSSIQDMSEEVPLEREWTIVPQQVSDSRRMQPIRLRLVKKRRVEPFL